MEKYRPKHYVLYIYGTEHKISIDCYPQSRWELVYETPSEVTLANKNIVMHITTEDFEKRWIKVNERK